MLRIILLVVGLMAGICQAQDVKKFIPENCVSLSSIVKHETDSFMPGFDNSWYFGALIEHESCISLKHSKCCSSRAQLKTPREFGAGVGQVTKAYNADGSIRFDTLSDLKNKYKNELKELSWNNILERADLQVRAMVLLTRGNYNTFFTVPDTMERIRMTDSAYNGGAKAVSNARMTCGLAAHCDPGIWFGNTERYLKKSTKPIYAGRSALDINLHHVSDVTETRRLKYQTLYH